MKDATGKELTPKELRKILQANSHPQFDWYSPKSRPPIGEGRAPKGVRIGREIKKL